MVGNLKNYTKIDILRCLLRIGKPVSRSELSKTLDLGEGTIRSILDVLKENGFLGSNKHGHFLRPKGDNILDKIRDNAIIKEIDSAKIFPGQKKIGIQIKNAKDPEKSYILRDSAVKNGADGAIIIKYGHDKKLKILDAKYDLDFSEIENKFSLNYGDIIVIAYADSYRLAEHGALAVATHLNDDLKHLMDKF
jgi:DNA-binding transcriptional ArsR family regulator